MKSAYFAAALAVLTASSAMAQVNAPEAATPAPLAVAPAVTAIQPIVAQPVDMNAITLPANTEIVLSMNETLDSRRNHENDTFNLTVVGDVTLGNYVVIPAGTRATGQITWMTGRGMFGKSGKMDIALRYVELGGRQIPIEGTFRQEGEGNTVATIAAVVLVAPVVGFFITGHSAVIPEGRQLTARTRDAIPVALPANASIAAPAIQATLAVAGMPAADAPDVAAPAAAAVAVAAADATDGTD